jgi:asparagine synthase (glutamine-hydrolysing)
MCGINGFWNLHGRRLDHAPELMGRMNQALQHRGPDDEGYWGTETEGVHLGHRRLSIIDLSPAGHQPMLSPSGNVIVFNGEIYNYKELREQFFRGERLRSDSDTEILLLLYERFGERCLDHLNGMFAFAIWDPRKEELFLARDRAGKKPIYYTLQEGVFAFSSELRSLFELPFVKRELDESALYHFLTYNLLPPPLTMFKGIHKFHPAHWMKVKRNGIHEYQPYWEVGYQHTGARDERELSAEVLEGLRKAVSYRMVADVPVGAFLSGGVDSSAIVALMSGMTTVPVKTYSIGFSGQPEFDERVYAERISKKFGTDHYERQVTPDDIREFLPKMVDIFDEPLADATCIPIHFISEKARENGTIVVLTGDGSDELFAGYRNWMRVAGLYPAFERFRAMPAMLKRPVAGLYGLLDSTSPRYEILSRAARDQEFFWGGAKSFKESTKRDFLSEDYNRRTTELDSHSVIASFRRQYEEADRRSDSSPLDWMCYLGFKFNVPNYYLHRMDRLGMAHSIEVRTPFLDYQFVNMALNIPEKWKIRDGEPKWILKKSLEGLLDHDILYRKKRGFNVPLKAWAGDLMVDYISKNLRPFCNDFPQFRYEGLHRQVERLKGGNEQVANTLWTLYYLMAWFRRWLG